MKCEVGFKCGHVDIVRLFETREEVDLQVASMEKYCDCPQCALTKYGHVPNVSFEDAMENSGQWTLPHMFGSFKQIKWAMSLRAQVMMLPDDTLWYLCYQEGHTLGIIPRYHDICAMFFGGPHDQDPGSVRQFIRDAAARQIDATWWIAGQEHCARELINAFLRHLGDNLNAKIQRAKEEKKQLEKLKQIYKTDQIFVVDPKKEHAHGDNDDCFKRFIGHPNENPHKSMAQPPADTMEIPRPEDVLKKEDATPAHTPEAQPETKIESKPKSKPNKKAKSKKKRRK